MNTSDQHRLEELAWKLIRTAGRLTPDELAEYDDLIAKNDTHLDGTPKVARRARRLAGNGISSPAEKSSGRLRTSPAERSTKKAPRG